MNPDYFYCIKNFNGFGHTFTAHKIYKAFFYHEYQKDFILLIDDNENEIDFLQNSLLGKELIPNYLITLEQHRKQRKEKLNKINESNL